MVWAGGVGYRIILSPEKHHEGARRRAVVRFPHPTRTRAAPLVPTAVAAARRLLVESTRAFPRTAVRLPPVSLGRRQSFPLGVW